MASAVSQKASIQSHSAGSLHDRYQAALGAVAAVEVQLQGGAARGEQTQLHSLLRTAEDRFGASFLPFAQRRLHLTKFGLSLPTAEVHSEIFLAAREGRAPRLQIGAHEGPNLLSYSELRKQLPFLKVDIPQSSAQIQMSLLSVCSRRVSAAKLKFDSCSGRSELLLRHHQHAILMIGCKRSRQRTKRSIATPTDKRAGSSSPRNRCINRPSHSSQ